MTTPTRFADRVRMVSEVALRAIQENERGAEAERREYDAREYDAGVQEALDNLLGFYGTIQKAAESGGRLAMFGIFKSREDAVMTSRERGYAETLMKSFRKEGFKCDMQQDRHDPAGSDALFCRNLYNLDMRVEW